MLAVGTRVINEYGRIGKVARSTFGYKVTGFHDDGTYWKTHGMSYEELSKYWTTI